MVNMPLATASSRRTPPRPHRGHPHMNVAAGREAKARTLPPCLRLAVMPDHLRPALAVIGLLGAAGCRGSLVSGWALRPAIAGSLGSSPAAGSMAGGPFIYHGQATLAPICLTGPAATAKFRPCITTPLS